MNYAHEEIRIVMTEVHFLRLGSNLNGNDNTGYKHIQNFTFPMNQYSLQVIHLKSMEVIISFFFP